MKSKIAILAHNNDALRLFSIVSRSLPEITLAHTSCSASGLSLEEVVRLDLLVVDIDTDGFSMALLEKFIVHHPKLQILITGEYITQEGLYLILRTGVGGIMKRADYDMMPVAITRLLSGGGYLSPEISRIIVKGFWLSSHSTITNREREILELMASGKNNSEISRQLDISPETSKVHIKNIYKKLNVNKRYKALKVAREERLII